jgi:hypothetical protein
MPEPADAVAEAGSMEIEPVAVAKLAADAADYSTAGYVLLKMGGAKAPVITLEVHDDGTVIPPDDWEVTVRDGMITGARHTGQPAENCGLRRWRPPAGRR